MAANKTSYRDNTTQGSTTYTYRVLAKEGDATLRQSEVSIITPAASTLVVPVQLLVSSQTADQLELRWLYGGAVSEVDLVIERKTEGNGFVMHATLTEGETQYTDLNLSPATAMPTRCLPGSKVIILNARTTLMKQPGLRTHWPLLSRSVMLPGKPSTTATSAA